MTAEQGDRNDFRNPPHSKTFQIIALSPAGLIDPSIPAAASRAGCLGVLDLEYARDHEDRVWRPCGNWRGIGGKSGIKLNAENDRLIHAVSGKLPSSISTVILTPAKPGGLRTLVEAFHARDLFVILEVTSAAGAMEGSTAGADALLAKGNEAGGFVGEKTTFILLQQILSKTKLPVYAQGGSGTCIRPLPVTRQARRALFSMRSCS